MFVEDPLLFKLFLKFIFINVLKRVFKEAVVVFQFRIFGSQVDRIPPFKGKIHAGVRKPPHRVFRVENSQGGPRTFDVADFDFLGFSAILRHIF